MPKHQNARAIIIYNDYGTSSTSVSATQESLTQVFGDKYAIILADKSYVNHADWPSKTALFVMPGGFTRPHYDNLAEGGNQKISQFVNSGGKYLGICAGGYYGCRRTEFDVNHPLEVILEGPLNFYAGTAIGPAYGPNTYQYDSESGMRAAHIGCPDGKTPSTKVYFNGGCYFSEPEALLTESTLTESTLTKSPITAFKGIQQNVTVLSRYLDLPNNPPAIIATQNNRGIAVLSGVHFETSAKFIDKSEGADAADCQELENHEAGRAALFQNILINVLSL